MSPPLALPVSCTCCHTVLLQYFYMSIPRYCRMDGRMLPLRTCVPIPRPPSRIRGFASLLAFSARFSAARQADWGRHRANLTPRSPYRRFWALDTGRQTTSTAGCGTYPWPRVWSALGVRTSGKQLQGRQSSLCQRADRRLADQGCVSVTGAGERRDKAGAADFRTSPASQRRPREFRLGS